MTVAISPGIEDMSETNAKPPAFPQACDSVKRAYKPPELTSFGAVHRLTQATGPANGDGGQDMMARSMSDRRVKERIVRIGEHPLGIGLYLFDYRAEFRDRWGHGRQFGVMADEVAAVMPEAVSTHECGFEVVDYAMLGIRRARH